MPRSLHDIGGRKAENDIGEETNMHAANSTIVYYHVKEQTGEIRITQYAVRNNRTPKKAARRDRYMRLISDVARLDDAGDRTLVLESWCDHVLLRRKSECE